MVNISSLIQLLALGGFLLGFAGIALVVSAVSQGRPARGGVVLAGFGIIVGAVLLIVSQGILVVGPTERAVVFNTISGELETPRRSGISIIIPGIQQVSIYPIGQQNYTMSDTSGEGQRGTTDDAVRARSVDGQEILLDITIIFRLVDQAEQLNRIHIDWANEPGGYTEGLIRPTVRSVVRDVIGGFQAESIYGRGREEVQEQINLLLIPRLEDRGVLVTDILIRDINFSREFIEAIEAKQVEEQRLQRAVTEAERVRREAIGRANAQIAEAQGESQARLIRAQAEAQALAIISQQIAANPNLIQYTYIQSLADNVSLALIPTNSPFLFDLDSFIQLGDDFTPPDVPEIRIEDIDFGTEAEVNR